ncbi:hypothetical protein LTR37_020309 [Vermiconidia calcicola]|uniref:Uncharacterized protein n=1 Tax=Vermiconidia calcicola TaxID=1690605 RepID=A0ACC3MBM1_9PEZI|nr:hypothetical protein LTR37_020309 [Vermiconidia calcicola]
MTSQPNGTNGDHAKATPEHYDAIVIGGGGFSGLRALYEVRRQGLNAKAFEAGSGIGGTWYWNRYPGARTDSESWTFIFSFLREYGLDDWAWKERYPQQDEVEVYLNRLADHLELRQMIQFSTLVTAARRDEKRNVWKVKTSDGGEYTCKFLITGSGPLATPVDPPFPGLKSFKGEWYQTGLWPKEKVDFAGKRVAVVGAGATAVQVIPIVAHSAKHLTVFQRTPNYVIPSRNHPLTPEQYGEIKRDYKDIKQRALGQTWGFDMFDSKDMYTIIKEDPEEVQRVLDRGWEKGGFRYFFETFADLLMDEDCNKQVSDFVRRKIRTVVRDKETAEVLCPKYPVVTKRPPLGHHYYETFNKPNVSLVDCMKVPIEDVTPAGIKTADNEYDFDMIIFALGFDAVLGTLDKIDIRNENNERLGDNLKANLEVNLGSTVPGFANMFMIFGPTAAFANSPLIIDITSDFAGQTIAWMKENNVDRCESTKEGAEKWSQHVRDLYDMLIISKQKDNVRSWLMGNNIPGKKVTPVFFYGGVPAYYAALTKEREDGYPGHMFSKTDGPALTA